jgi:hypothetical protein
MSVSTYDFCSVSLAHHFLFLHHCTVPSFHFALPALNYNLSTQRTHCFTSVHKFAPRRHWLTWRLKLTAQLEDSIAFLPMPSYFGNFWLSERDGCFVNNLESDSKGGVIKSKTIVNGRHMCTVRPQARFARQNALNFQRDEDKTVRVCIHLERLLTKCLSSWEWGGKFIFPSDEWNSGLLVYMDLFH